MSELRLRTLAIFSTAPEAGALQSALEMQGITCLTNNAEAVSNLWHLSNAMGGISVQVAEQDWEAAQAVMRAAPGGQPWVCPTCGARVDAGFDLCWRCSADPQLLEVGPADECELGTEVEALPAARLTVEPVSEQLAPEISTTDGNPMLDELSRAWKCAVIGLCVCGIPNVYSLLILLTRIRLDDLPESVRWKYVAAFLLDVIVLVSLMALIVGR